MRTLDVGDYFACVGAFELPALVPGMAVVLWTDKGPSGPCGQSMNTTCPHAGLIFFSDEDAAREHFNKHALRRGQRSDVRMFVVGDGGDGRFSISVHDGVK